MSLLRRMFNSDYRTAVAAEAAGNVDLAAERYALAGDRDGAVRMHLARAARAATRHTELAALRDAMKWAGEDAALRTRASGALGRALWASAQAEGVATQRDRTRVREAADLLVAGEDHATAGEALEAIGDHVAAANAYSAGGLVERMEMALAADDDIQHRARQEHDAFADFETHMRTGRRDDARAELVRAVAAASVANEYRRRLDELDAALLTGGKVELRRRNKPMIVACAAPRIILGRDPLCDLTLRAGGVSRQHAEVERVAAHDGKPASFVLRDLDSRNGTTIRGLPVVGRVPLAGHGEFGLGDECTIEYEASDARLILRVAGGLDRGVTLIAADDGARIELSPAGSPLVLTFRNGRPLLDRGTAADVLFNHEPVGDIRMQLIRGDQVVADGDELDIG